MSDFTSRLIQIIDKSKEKFLRLEPLDLEHVTDERLRRALHQSHMNTTLAIKSAFQIHSVLQDSYILYRMVGKYPWRSKYISRSDHIRIVWHSFEHQCYLYFEKIKLFLNRLQIAERSMGINELTNFKLELANVMNIVGDRIKSRGVNTHKFIEDPGSVSYLKMIEILSIGGDERFGSPLDHYSDVKWLIRKEIGEHNRNMMKHSVVNMDPFWKRLESAVAKFDSIYILASENPQQLIVNELQR